MLAQSQHKQQNPELHRGRLFHPQGDIMGSADCGFCVLLDEAKDSTLLVNIEEIVVDIVC